MEAKQAHRIATLRQDIRAELEQDEKSWFEELNDLRDNDEVTDQEEGWLRGERAAEDGEDLWKQRDEDSLWGWEE